MKNETFSFGRFRNYFKFDLKQMWRNHSRPAIFIGGMELIIYLIWVLLGLVFSGGEWHGPSVAARICILVLAFAVLELYQTRTYGYLTQRKQGSSWLMVPASSTEKFVSMLLITLLVIPVLFLVVFLSVDALISLADPTVGPSIVGFLSSGIQQAFSQLEPEDVSLFLDMSGGHLTWLLVLGFIVNFLYWLLCGLCFKRYKILGGIALVLGVEIVLSILGSTLIPGLSEQLVSLDEGSARQAVNHFLGWVVALSAALAVGLGGGIFYRIKTIKH